MEGHRYMAEMRVDLVFGLLGDTAIMVLISGME